MKVSKSVTIDSKLLEWVETQIEEKRFASLSHAVELALYLLKKETNNKKT